MPKAVSHHETTPLGRRKSSRAKKTTPSYTDEDIPLGSQQNSKVPSGDSEDDYKPEMKPEVGSLKLNNHERSPQSKKLRPALDKDNSTKKLFEDTEKLSINPMFVKPDPDESSEPCVLCSFKIKVETGNADGRFHYANHMYEGGRFSSLVPEVDGVTRYHCPHMERGCTKRKMNHREVCMHVATQHQELKGLLASDTRPGLKSVLAMLYPSPVKQVPFSVESIKQEPKGLSAFSCVKEEENSEDIDDPAPPPPSSTKTTRIPLPVAVKVKANPAAKMTLPVPEIIRVDKVHSCMICKKKEGRNLNLGVGFSDLKYHYSVCYYEDEGVNRYRNMVDPGPDNQDSQGQVLEEFGIRFRYKCPFTHCSKNQGRKKDMGYKEFCIHTGMKHHFVEIVIGEDLARRPQLEEVLAAFIRQREKDGEQVVELPKLIVEEVHTCYICRGRDKITGKEDREAKTLSFQADSISRTRYHYASCFYDTEVYLAKYPPGEDNTTEDGRVKDTLGKLTKYSCREPGCNNKRKMGYKEFCIHMSNDHGGLEEVLGEHEMEECRALVKKFGQAKRKK